MSQKAKNNNDQSLMIEFLNDCEIEVVNQLEIESGLTPTALPNRKPDSTDSIFNLTAKFNDKIVGFASVRLITPVVEIDQIAVAPLFRRKQIGGALLQAVVKIANQNRTDEIWLEVRESNYAAISFYLRNEFEIVGKRKSYYSAPAENAILMSLRISKTDDQFDKKSKAELDAADQLE